MYKGASESLQRRHAVDKPHPSRGYIDGAPDERDVIAEANAMNLAQAEEEKRRLALEISKSEQDIAVARAAGWEGKAKHLGWKKCALQARQKAINARIRDINRQVSGDVFRAAVKAVVSERTFKRIVAKAMELSASAGEAQRAETTQIGSVHEHATAESRDAQTLSPSPLTKRVDQ